MLCRGPSARALFAGVSAIALNVAGAASPAGAEEVVELDPLTIVATKPVQRTREAPPRVTTARRPSASRTQPSETPRTQSPVQAAPAPEPAAVPDPMPATETLAGASTVRQARRI